MTANEYQREAMRTLNPALGQQDILVNGVMGLCGEAGEAINIVKKHLAQGHPLDREALIRELGDVAWYLAETATALDLDLDAVLSQNLAKLRARALRRPGILAGLAAFVLAAYCVNIPVLRIDVAGSARYEEEAYAVLAESGVRTFALCGEEEREAARRALLALPGVVFASVEKAGCVVTAVIEESEETPLPERERELSSPRAGKVEELAVLRGTALVSEGDAVAAGQTLVAGYFLTEEGERRETFAVARASILCTFSAEYFSAERSDAAAADAVAAAHLAAGGELVSSEVSVRAEGDGYIYGAAVTVRLRISVNLD